MTHERKPCSLGQAFTMAPNAHPTQLLLEFVVSVALDSDGGYRIYCWLPRLQPYYRYVSYTDIDIADNLMMDCLVYLVYIL